MKYTKLFVLGFALAGLVTSCEDAYKLKQPGEVNDPDQVYNNVEDLQRGLNSVYRLLSTDKTIEFTSIFTDEVAIGINNGGQGITDGLYQHVITAGNDAAGSIWQSNYTMINFANRILAAAEKLEAEYGEDPDFKNIVGQLYAIRAFGHFQLITWFSTDPADDNALGVIKLDFVPDYNYNTNLPRVTNGELYTFINDDLTEAEAQLTAGSFGTEPNKAGVNFINAIRARMALYRKDYVNAAAYAHTVILNTGGYTSGLVNTAAGFYDILDNSSTSESVFTITRVYGDSQIGAYWNSVSSAYTGSPFYEVGRDLYNKYKVVSTDIRNQNTSASEGTLVDNTSVISANPDAEPDYVNNDVLVVNRYPGNPTQGDQLLNDVRVFTLGEMYLIRAEALANMGNLTGTTNTSAQYVMRQLRRRRYANTSYAAPAYASTQEAVTDIFHERRLELAFLGQRYIDIKRLGATVGEGISRYSRDCEQYGACTLTAPDYRFTLPIPNSEITANPAIRSQQNPGY